MESTHSPVRPQPIGAQDPVHSRRKFLRVAGATGVLAAALAACRHQVIGPNPGGGKKPGTGKTVHLGSGDTGILNYAYALEQLEAAFYSKVIESPYNQMSDDEKSLLEDIRDHEIAHREFCKSALGTNAIPGLTPDFNTIDFTSRDSVLATAKAFEDLGVSAYNGVGSLITDPDYLTFAGKIVSVEARHAAFIRTLISEGSFADSTVIDANGLDMSRTPPQVLAIAGAYIIESIDASQLPTS
jgi:hypothetical protein